MPPSWVLRDAPAGDYIIKIIIGSVCGEGSNAENEGCLIRPIIIACFQCFYILSTWAAIFHAAKAMQECLRYDNQELSFHSCEAPATPHLGP